MICARCGMNVSENSQYCQYCGTKVGALAVSSPTVKNTSGKLKIRMSGSAKEPYSGKDAETGVVSAPASAAASFPYDTQTGSFRSTNCSLSSRTPPTHPAYAPTGITAYLPAESSYFDGTFLGYLGVNLVTSFFSLITLGLAFPWLWCYKQRWIYEHTCINGYRLHFDGRGIQLFGKWLLWVLLTIITLTVFAFWIPIQLKKWEVKHVFIGAAVITPR